MNYYCMPHKPPTWGCLASGDKKGKRLCPGTMVGGGQSRFSCGKGSGYSGRLTEMASSSSWACSMMPGASSNQEAELHLYDILYRQS